MQKIVLFLLLLVTSCCVFAQTPEQRLTAAGLVLPKVKPPVANYVNVVKVGKLLYLSGKGPTDLEGKDITGKLGHDLSMEQGYAAAKWVALNHIAVLKDYLGDLRKVKRIVKVLGMVNCTDTFPDQPKVVNGYSDTMVQVFGEKGKHARSAAGFNALPNNIAIEVEVIVEIE